MRGLVLAMAALPLLTPAFASAEEAVDSTSTAAATVMGEMMRENVEHWRTIGVEVNDSVFAEVFVKSFLGKDTGMSMEAANSFMENLFESKRQAAERAAGANPEAEAAFVAAAAAREGAVTTPSGLVFEVITEGEGLAPVADDTVLVRYQGKLSDGSVFDGQTETPVEFQVSRLIPGFTEGLMMMKPGGTYRLVIPADLAYGSRGVPGVIPGGSALDFVVSLDGIK